MKRVWPKCSQVFGVNVCIFFLLLLLFMIAVSIDHHHFCYFKYFVEATRIFAHDSVQAKEMDRLENELRTILIGKIWESTESMNQTNGRIYLTRRIWRQRRKKKRRRFRVHDFSHTQSGQVDIAKSNLIQEIFIINC